MDRPDFFLVGAPRCGTTAMAKYLAQHPGVCFSKPKEPHYLSRPPREDTPDALCAEYIELFFPHRQPGQQLGEGSVSYLYSTDALALALEFNPEAHFLVHVRSPIDMIHSLHERQLYTMDEDVEDLATAWSLQEARMRGEHVPATCRDARLLQYAMLGQLGTAVENLFAQVGRDRCHVVVYDDFRADPRTAYQGVLRFLGLEDDGRTDFSRVRSNRKIKNRRLQLMLRSPDPRLMKLMGAKPTVPQNLAPGEKKKKPLIKRIRNRLIRRNTVIAERRAMDDEMRARLVDTFREDVGRLGRVLGRDFSPWLDAKRLDPQPESDQSP